MKKLLICLAVLIALVFGWLQIQGTYRGPGISVTISDEIAVAFRERRSGIQVASAGTVSRLLPDDNEGSRHQRFILSLASGQTLLIAHNIDLAPRINSLKLGDSVEFNGVYEWNSQGGVVHWTHHDPNGRHVPGWLKHRGKIFQ